MKGMPLPFDFQGKGVFDIFPYSSSSLTSHPLVQPQWNKQSCFVVVTSITSSEPTSVLDTIRRSPSPPTSTSTLSSSLGTRPTGVGSVSTDTASGVAAISGNPSSKWATQTHQDTPSSSNVGLLESIPTTTTTEPEKCGLGMEDWEGVLSDSAAASPSQEQSILRWIMGDVDDPSMGLNKVLQMSRPGPGLDFDFSSGFGVSDQCSAMDSVHQIISSGSGGGGGNLMGTIDNPTLNLPTSGLGNKIGFVSNNLAGFSQSPNQQARFECSDLKPQVFNPHLVINHHQNQHAQNPSFILPIQDQNHLIMPPNPKRHNTGSLEPDCPIPKGPFLDLGHEMFTGRQQLPFQVTSHYVQQRPAMGMKMKTIGDEMGQFHLHQQQQAIIDQLYKAAELVQTGNPVLAQQILARLNQQLSPIGKPFHRAAFYFKEALQFLFNNMANSAATLPHSTPFSLIYKIGAYKLFSEISPLVQFSNFTCNQALLEVLQGFDQIHVIDFDIGYGGQWASLMQELALRNGGAPSLKITAFVSQSTHDQLELSLTRKNLVDFANEINMALEFDIGNLDALSSSSWSLPLRVMENEAIAVNLPVGSFFNYQLSLPMVLRFVKQISPKIVVSVDRGCDRTDLLFPNHVILALQSYTSLFESLDAVNVNLDALQKIERFLFQPNIEKIIMGRYGSPEKTQHWRTLFLSSGFSPLTFSNFTESQAECVLKRTTVRGFHVEKTQTSLVLCWQGKELVAASAWRC